MLFVMIAFLSTAPAEASSPSAMQAIAVADPVVETATVAATTTTALDLRRRRIAENSASAREGGSGRSSGSTEGAGEAEGAAPALPKKLGAGTEGLFQPGILLQGWFFATRAAETTTTFRIRRAEIIVKGDIIQDRISYSVTFDPARVLEPKETVISVSNQSPPPDAGGAPEQVTVKQPVGAASIFQNFSITFKFPYVDASIGQFKIPVSWEGFGPASKLLFPERAIVSNTYGDKRDLGVSFSKTFPRFGYSAGLFNGTTSNNLDTNNAKDAALRLEAYPIDGLVLAGVAYGTIGQRGEAGMKDRYEGDLRFERGPFLVQSEYIRARDRGRDRKIIEGQGFYTAFAYMLLDEVQAAIRLGYFDPDVDRELDPSTDGGRDELWHYEVGLNGFILKDEAKVQASYSRFQFDDKKASNEVLFAVQLSY